MKHYPLKIILGLFILLTLVAQPIVRVAAVQSESEGPVYIVQSGDSLWSIALRFRVSVTDLAAINQITDLNQLSVGDQLTIPGLEGITGILTTKVVSYGDTLTSLSRRFQIPEDSLIQLNHITSPSELYAGIDLVIPEQNLNTGPDQRATLLTGQSILELAVQNSANPWDYVLKNQFSGASGVIPGAVLHLPGKAPSNSLLNEPSALPQAISKIQFVPNPAVQGKTIIMKVSADSNIALSGSLAGRPLHFFTFENNEYVSLQGIHAMTEPGLFNLAITMTIPAYASIPLTFSQAVLVESGNYPFDPVLTVDPDTIDPTVTQPEDVQWLSLTSPISPDRLWEGMFQNPVAKDFSECWPSVFGNRRSYNGSAYTYFHTGLDFCGSVGNDIYAPAAGNVVFTGLLTVRGNATVIDHGWGVYTAYLHQSEILVNINDRVEAGQLIGRVGKTGRVTGPHLHWEVWVGGVQVDPMDWMKQVFP